MLTLQKTDSEEIISIPTDKKNVEGLLTKEWLLTNDRGSYASSTIIGCNTRRYHGLLIGSTNPPANRIMALANCMEMVILNGNVFNLSTFEFSGKFAPVGFNFLKRFRRDTAVHFDYQLPQFKLTKSVYLLRDADMIALVYDFTAVKKPLELVLRPFIGLRDFHTLQKSYAHLYSAWLGDGLLIRHDIPGSCELFLSCPSMKFEKDHQWWFNFTYRIDEQRGQDFTEDLWTPGFFKGSIDSPARIVLWANFGSSGKAASDAEELKLDIEAVREDLCRHQSRITAAAKTKDLRKLCLAADQFIAKRSTAAPGRDEQRTTILAGFPWFADWGRDAFISLPGLLLATGRFEEAKSVLATFAAAADEGVIPNRFDDRSDTAYFNSVDASLWFINAAFQYLNAAGDSETFTMQLLPVIRRIIDSYHQGNPFGICADADGLITAGNEQTQLTWMDAKYDGVAFTARYGKAVEVNALWYNALCWLVQFYDSRDDMDNAKHYRDLADKVKNSFCRSFWNEQAGCLHDCILPDGSADASLRPNQIFAVSLPFSPLSPQQQKAVVDAVQKNLLTPFGLRTLNVQDNRYKGTYTGSQKERDQAYHQGTVWPYLLGPFVESYLKVYGHSRKSKKEASEFIKPLLQYMTKDGCLGQICEIFDGDPPHKPKGCMAQAWSIAELIRAYQLVRP
ncbi:MAG: amylo-alpha-1,6-glucosidase [Phycisphaerae bacterium]|nr:amylo-alpha-1,6-glucosidase [Phycisphaerae bacterium]MDD5380336.1 amylo-alpha-1,6-glucosidase [Phycisphaerae bacterium]